MSRDPNPLFGEWKPLRQWEDLETRPVVVGIGYVHPEEAQAMRLADILRDCKGLMMRAGHYHGSSTEGLVMESIELGHRVYEFIHGRSNVGRSNVVLDSVSKGAI